MAKPSMIGGVPNSRRGPAEVAAGQHIEATVLSAAAATARIASLLFSIHD